MKKKFVLGATLLIAAIAPLSAYAATGLQNSNSGAASQTATAKLQAGTTADKKSGSIQVNASTFADKDKQADSMPPGVVSVLSGDISASTLESSATLEPGTKADEKSGLIQVNASTFADNDKQTDSIPPGVVSVLSGDIGASTLESSAKLESGTKADMKSGSIQVSASTSAGKDK